MGRIASVVLVSSAGELQGMLPPIELCGPYWPESADLVAEVTDLMGLIGGLSQTEAAPLVARWCAGWKSLAPRSKPERALELAPLLGALHGAATYAHFLSQIEETEWPYHSEDVPRCLQAADGMRGALHP